MTQTQLSALNAKATRYFEIKRTLDPLQKEMKELEKAFRELVAGDGESTVAGEGWVAHKAANYFKQTVTKDSIERLLKEMPEVYKEYVDLNPTAGSFTLKPTA